MNRAPFPSTFIVHLPIKTGTRSQVHAAAPTPLPATSFPRQHPQLSPSPPLPGRLELVISHLPPPLDSIGSSPAPQGRHELTPLLLIVDPWPHRRTPPSSATTVRPHLFVVRRLQTTPSHSADKEDHQHTRRGRLFLFRRSPRVPGHRSRNPADAVEPPPHGSTTTPTSLLL